MNCKLSNWSKWSACSNKCGGIGVQVRTRTIATKAKYGGKCVGAKIETKPCEGNCSNIPGIIVTVLHFLYIPNFPQESKNCFSVFCNIIGRNTKLFHIYNHISCFILIKYLLFNRM